MAQPVKKTLVRAGVMCFAISVSLLASFHTQSQRDAFSKWRPTHELAGVNYVVCAACARCHAPLTAKCLAYPMSCALASVESREILKIHIRLHISNGPYTY